VKVDLSRYQECPSCHTFQGNLRPCRKCGWHVDWNKRVAVPEIVRIKSSIKMPGPKPKPRYTCRALALLRVLEDGEWHPVADLRRRGIIGRWEPRTFTWQANLESLGIIGYDRIPTRAKGYCLRIMPGKMQEAKKLMARLEDVEDGEDERGKTEL
jgi:cytochrome c5